MAAAAGHDPKTVIHRLLHGIDHLLGRADETNVVRLSSEPLVESPSHQLGEPRISGPIFPPQHGRRSRSYGGSDFSGSVTI